jgi:hypothetical protein
MLNTFNAAPELSEEMKELIKELGKRWADDPRRPQLKPDVLHHWSKLVSDWANDDSLPLYVRKKRKEFARGSVVPHSGRSIVLADNSPAHWAFVQAYQEYKPTRDHIAAMIKKNEVPVAMALTTQEVKRKPKYTCLLKEFEKQSETSVNSAGWYLAHIDDVRLNGKLENLDISRIKEHFIRFMNPSNMFLIPDDYSGLSGLREFKEEIRLATAAATEQ